jgi:hypothetical protein
MDLDEESKSAPPPASRTSIAQSMLVLGNAVTELVDRMEREVARRGTINDDSVRELRRLRVEAEQLMDLGWSNMGGDGDR